MSTAVTLDARVLIVDDDAALLQALPETLRLRLPQVAVDACESAASALDLLAASDYDAVVSDIKLPGMDGLALLREIRARQPDTPTLLITGHGEHDLAVQALRGGAFDFIQKPIDRDYFVASLARAIRMRQLSRQVERQQAALERHAAELEQRVAERTHQLEAANQELEAFSYSVAHDLRAPLRSISGFSQTLLEDHADRLDAEGRDALGRIHRAARRMGQLIDALLALSQVGRGGLRRDAVDLSVLAEVIAAEHRARESGRQVALAVQPGLIVDGDPPLLRVALENLLDNAWKFTARRADAYIEVGAVGIEGKQTYFVRDNGIGFDMAFADQIFRPFQRLHDAADFPGAGIGLATVQRIVRQHGGRVWVEAVEGQGATFYFTL